jgi:inner membrane protease subunit 2
VVALEGDIVRDREHGVARRIPAGHCWVEGDNALRSTRDSNKLGPVPVALVQGRVARVVWPPSHARSVLPVLPEADRYTRKAAKNKDAVLC